MLTNINYLKRLFFCSFAVGEASGDGGQCSSWAHGQLWREAFHNQDPFPRWDHYAAEVPGRTPSEGTAKLLSFFLSSSLMDSWSCSSALGPDELLWCKELLTFWVQNPHWVSKKRCKSFSKSLRSMLMYSHKPTMSPLPPTPTPHLLTA